MKQLACKTEPPSLQELEGQLKDRAVFGMVVSFSILPIVLVDKDKVQSIDEMLPLTVHPGMRTARFRRIMSHRLPLYDRMGFFDL